MPSSGAIDLATVIEASQAISSEIALDKLLAKLMKIAIENAGAQTGFLLLPDRSDLATETTRWAIEAEGRVSAGDAIVIQSIAIDAADPTVSQRLSTAIVNYVARTQANVILNDAAREGQFTTDPYAIATQPKSLLCMPLIVGRASLLEPRGQLSAILYLENNLTTNAFTTDRVEVLKILSAQAAISIENSRFYERLENYGRTLEQKVAARSQELSQTLENPKYRRLTFALLGVAFPTAVKLPGLRIWCDRRRSKIGNFRTIFDRDWIDRYA